MAHYNPSDRLMRLGRYQDALSTISAIGTPAADRGEDEENERSEFGYFGSTKRRFSYALKQARDMDENCFIKVREWPTMATRECDQPI
jgi:hypothetical protein